MSGIRVPRAPACRPAARAASAVLTACVSLAVAACVPPRVSTGPAAAGRPARFAQGPLAIHVVYPKDSDVIQSHDSAFIFGSVGRGDARLTVNGTAVPVIADGAWIAWVPLPDDTVAWFRIVATADSDSVVRIFRARIAPRFHPPAGTAAWIDTTSFRPRGTLAFPAGEGIRLSVSAAPGAAVSLRLPSGRVVPFVPDSLPAEPAWGVRAFGRDTVTYHLPPEPGRFVAWLQAESVARDSSLLVVIRGTDTARAAWPLALDTVNRAAPAVIELDDDTAHTGTTDSLSVGRAEPGGTYHWFFPTGTRAVVDARWNDEIRLRLSRESVAWVNAADAVPLAPGTPPPGGAVGSVRLTPAPGYVRLRVPLPAPVPFLVEEDDRRLTIRLYGVTSDVNWMQYGGTDPLIRRMDYAQPLADEVTITLELSSPVWGYRARFDGRDLILDVRRPPDIDARRPLRGRVIAIDPGHPPIGAMGPTGLWEPVATLAVAKKVQALLEQAGATVLLTRHDSTPIDLFPRVHFAETHDAELLVSIHANALPDGINPFENDGTSTYYFHPRSADLARDLDRDLVAQLGTRDLGFGRGDYALVRGTWMPSALTEALFIMMPDQEAVLASDDGQWRYARGVVNGIRDFLRERAAER